MDLDLSVIIPARNEHPQATWTLQCMWDQLERSSFTWETILVDNLSDDGTAGFIKNRWWEGTGKHRTIEYKEGGSCWQARNMGLDYARGRHLFFFDAHIIISPDFFEPQMEVLDGGAEIVYAPLRIFSDKRANTMYGYSLGPDHRHLRTKFWGSWTRRRLSDQPYPIPMSGTASIGVRADWIRSFDGWPKALGLYGGGEQWVSLLTWMLGGRCLLDPRVYFYHWNEKRKYPMEGMNEQHHFNKSFVSYALGGEKWWETQYAGEMRRHAEEYHEAFRALSLKARSDAETARAWVEEHAQHTLDEVLETGPWALREAPLSRQGD